MALQPLLYDLINNIEKSAAIDLTSMVSGLLPATHINVDGTTLNGSGASLAVNNLGITAAKLSTGAGSDWQQLIYDSSTNALAWKSNTSTVQPCRVAATSNITISSPGTSIDGVTLNINDRILLTNQTTASQNGCYVFNGSSSPLTRTSDTNAGTRLTPGTMIQVWAGTVNANSIWILSTDNAITIGTTNLSFTKLNSGTVSSVSIVTANGISGTVATATTTPAITLTLGNITPTGVNITASKPALILTNTDSSGYQLQLRNGASGNVAFDLYNATNSATLFGVTSDGEMRIGTSTNILGNTSRLFVFGGTAGANIDVMGDSTQGSGFGDQAVIELEGSDYATKSYSIAMQYYGSAVPAGTALGYPLANTGLIRHQGPDNSHFILYTANKADIHFATDYVERAIISKLGNFGIGTNAPGALLQVTQPTTGTGTVSTTSGSPNVTGNGTQFTNTFNQNDTITIGAETHTISSITSDTALVTSTNFTHNYTNQSYTLTGGTRFQVFGNGNVSIPNVIATNANSVTLGNTSNTNFSVYFPTPSVPYVLYTNKADGTLHLTGSGGNGFIIDNDTQLNLLGSLLLSMDANSQNAFQGITQAFYASSTNMGSKITLARSKSSTIGGMASVGNNDQISNIEFQGANGSSLATIANIFTIVDGSPSSNIPSRIEFWTGTNAASPALGMKLDSNKNLTVTGTITGSNISGTNTGDQTIFLTGDVTGSGTGSFSTTIANSAVTLAKMANLSANSIIGNNTGSSATPIALSAAQVKVLLAIANTDISGLGTMSTQNANTVNITGGSITATLSGEVFSTSASVSAAGNSQGTATALSSDYNIVTSVSAGQGVILPATTVGRRIIVINKGANTLTVYPAVSSTIDSLSVNAGISIPVNGGIEFNASSTTQWYSTLGFMSTSALTGDITASGTSNSLATTIASGAVSLSKMANLSANSIIGNNTGSPATPIALTAAQVLSLLNVTAGASVSSVGLSLPNIFSVSGSPVTTSGTLTATLANQNANLIFAGPVSGGASAPTFRSLVAADHGTGTATANTVLLGNLTWGTVPNAGLTNSSLTIGTTNIALGGTSTSLAGITNLTAASIGTTVNAIGTVGSTATVNWTTSSLATCTLTASTATTFTFTAPTVSGVYLTLEVTAPASGSASNPTWPATVVFPLGTMVLPYTAGGIVTKYIFYWDGTKYLCIDSEIEFATPQSGAFLYAGNNIGQTAANTFGKAATGSYIGWNYSGGSAEMDFLNYSSSATGGFNWYKSDGTTITQVSQLDASGLAHHPSIILAPLGTSQQNPAASAVTPPIQSLTATDYGANMLLGTYANTIVPAQLIFFKSKSGTIGTLSAVSSGDNLGAINWYGVNTTPASVAASTIRSIVDGAPSASNVPTRFEFVTSSTTGASVTASLNNYGAFTIGATTPYSFDSGNPIFQTQTISGRSLSTFTQWTNDAFGARMMFLKSRGTSVGSLTATSSSDELGIIGFHGVNTTPATTLSAYIYVTQTGAATSSGVPTSMGFYTSTGTATGVALTLDSSKNATFAGSVFIPQTAVLDLNSAIGQRINVYGGGTAGNTNYGVGIQPNTMYFRSGVGNFAWFGNGIHSNTQYDPGSGGILVAKLDQNGNFTSNNYTYNTFNIGTVTSTCAVNWSTNGGNQKATTTNATACTVSFTAPAGPSELVIALIGPASGTSGTITWPTFKGTAPTTTGIASGTTRMVWIWYDGANYWQTATQTA